MRNFLDPEDSEACKYIDLVINSANVLLTCLFGFRLLQMFISFKKRCIKKE